MSAAAARGRNFEGEVARLLRAAGFEVKVNPKIARPRQTDLSARGDGIELLVEVKNQQRKVDIDVVDSLRSRLDRTPSDIIGVIFTTSGLTKGAIEGIEADRRREVLAFVGAEIDHIRSGKKNFNTLVERKRAEFRDQGKVWFDTAEHSEFVGIKLPTGSVEFRLSNVISPYFESRSGFSGAFYSLEIPDPGWGSMDGEGARLRIRPALHSASGLRNIIGYLHEKFGLSSNGTFSIQQIESNWFGSGLDNFVRAAEQWRPRYAQSRSKKFHHSEQLIYFDQFRNGWIEISSQRRIDLSADSAGFWHNSTLAIQLPGVPVDMSPYLKLCRYTGNDWAHFEYVGRRRTSSVRFRKPTILSVVGTVVNRERYVDDPAEERMVIGVVAKNPFYRKKSLPEEVAELHSPPLVELRETELLVCSLRDWHDESARVDRYVLEGIEITVGDIARIIRPFGTWSEMLESTKDKGNIVPGPPDRTHHR